MYRVDNAYVTKFACHECGTQFSIEGTWNHIAEQLDASPLELFLKHFKSRLLPLHEFTVVANQDTVISAHAVKEDRSQYDLKKVTHGARVFALNAADARAFAVENRAAMEWVELDLNPEDLSLRPLWYPAPSSVDKAWDREVREEQARADRVLSRERDKRLSQWAQFLRANGLPKDTPIHYPQD